jgi:hypothetical protein
MKKLASASSLVIVIVALSGSAMASGWSSAVTIVDIEVSDPTGTAEHVYLSFSPPVSTPCRKGGTGKWLVGGSGDTPKDILSTAIAAKLAGRKVTVYWPSKCTGVAPGLWSGVPYVTGIDLK